MRLTILVRCSLSTRFKGVLLCVKHKRGFTKRHTNNAKATIHALWMEIERLRALKDVAPVRPSVDSRLMVLGDGHHGVRH